MNSNAGNKSKLFTLTKFFVDENNKLHVIDQEQVMVNLPSKAHLALTTFENLEDVNWKKLIESVQPLDKENTLDDRFDNRKKQ